MINTNNNILAFVVAEKIEADLNKIENLINGFSSLDHFRTFVLTNYDAVLSSFSISRKVLKDIHVPSSKAKSKTQMMMKTSGNPAWFSEAVAPDQVKIVQIHQLLIKYIVDISEKMDFIVERMKDHINDGNTTDLSHMIDIVMNIGRVLKPLENVKVSSSNFTNNNINNNNININNNNNNNNNKFEDVKQATENIQKLALKVNPKDEEEKDDDDSGKAYLKTKTKPYSVGDTNIFMKSPRLAAAGNGGEKVRSRSSSNISIVSPTFCPSSLRESDMILDSFQNTLFLSGYLYLLQKGQWYRKLWFTNRGNHSILLYFNSEAESGMVGSINLAEVELIEVVKTAKSDHSSSSSSTPSSLATPSPSLTTTTSGLGRSLDFFVRTQNNTFFLKTSTEYEMVYWLIGLRKIFFDIKYNRKKEDKFTSPLADEGTHGGGERGGHGKGRFFSRKGKSKKDAGGGKLTYVDYTFWSSACNIAEIPIYYLNRHLGGASTTIASIAGPEENKCDLDSTFLAGKSVSAYPRQTIPGQDLNDMDPETVTQVGDPNCDQFAVKVKDTCIIAAVGDGCNWGIRPRTTANICCTEFMAFMEKNICLVKSTDIFCTYLLRSLVHISEKIVEGKDDVWEAGTSTFLGGVVLPVDDPFALSSFYFGFVTIGDCKSFVLNSSSPPSSSSSDSGSRELREITVSNRQNTSDARDPGGRLGPYVGDGEPDLRNLRIYLEPVFAGDTIIIMSDGVHDNFDPQTLGELPSEHGINCSTWEEAEQEHPKESEKVKNNYQLKLMKKVIDEKTGKENPQPADITNCLVDFAFNITQSSRDWMESHPTEKLPSDYKKYPGKLDHTTCVAFTVGNTVSKS